MRVPLSTPLLTLALCSALATAARTHLDRADKSQEMPSCLCVLQETGQDDLKFAVLESSHFKTGEECQRGCPRQCHNKLSYLVNPSEAQALGAKHTSVPMMASQCDPVERCFCLDVNREEEGMQHQLVNMAETKKVFDSSHQCLSECRNECKQGYEGVCMYVWEWQWAVYSWNDACHAVNPDSVGLVACRYTQQFKLKKDGPEGGQVHKVQLDELADDSGNELQQIKLDVGLLEATTSTLSIKLGLLDDQGPWSTKTEWTMRQSGSSGPHEWEVLDSRGEVAFTVKKDKNREVWEVYRGEKEEILYHADGYEDEDMDEGHGDKDDDAGNGFEFTFLPEGKKDSWAGWVRKDTDGYTVEVEPGERAGLFLITSAILGKVYG